MTRRVKWKVKRIRSTDNMVTDVIIVRAISERGAKYVTSHWLGWVDPAYYTHIITRED